MAVADTIYQARFVLPEDFQKGRAETIKCPVYYQGALVAPSAGTVTVLNESGEVVIDGATATITGSVAQYAIGSTVFDNEDYGDGWIVKWELTISSAEHTFINDASLVRYKLYPVLTDADIIRRVPALDPNAASTIVTNSNYQDFIEEAWVELMHKIIQLGNRPNLIMSPTSIRHLHMYKVLEFVYRDLGSVNQPELLEEANRYSLMFEDAFNKTNFRYDEDEDGLPDAGPRKSAARVLWLKG